MFEGFDSSYPQLAVTHTDLQLVAPQEVRDDPVLERSVLYVDELCIQVFARRWPQISGLWGIEDADSPNACVIRFNGQAHVLLTRGACHLLAKLGEFVGTSSWVAKDLIPRLFSHEPNPIGTPPDLGEITQFFGLAALFGHEVGHVLDRHYIYACAELDPNSELAQEISADGHAIMMGLSVVEAWANDLATRVGAHEMALRRLGVALLVLANAVIDKVQLGVSWKIPPGDTHPPGAQRLMATCVHVNELFDQVDEPFGVTIFKIVVLGLSAFGVYDGPIDDDALKLLINMYDPILVAEQSDALRETLNERGL